MADSVEINKQFELYEATHETKYFEEAYRLTNPSIERSLARYGSKTDPHVIEACQRSWVIIVERREKGILYTSYKNIVGYLCTTANRCWVADFHRRSSGDETSNKCGVVYGYFDHVIDTESAVEKIMASLSEVEIIIVRGWFLRNQSKKEIVAHLKHLIPEYFDSQIMNKVNNTLKKFKQNLCRELGVPMPSSNKVKRAVAKAMKGNRSVVALQKPGGSA